MAEEIKIINIYQKLQKSRVELQAKNLKKSGKNSYSNYEYFELGDFLPGVNEVCNNNGLATIFHFEKEIATLTIIDVDNPESIIKFETPIEMAAIKGSSTIQQIGGTQTYARRYLYMMAFEIAETDIVDKSEVDLEKQEGEQRIGTVHLNVIRKLIDETETEITSFLKYAGVEKLEDIKNKDYPELLKLLEKKKQDYKRKQENARKLKEQQEQYQKELEAKQENFEF
ncbi:ERF family protein [Clostridium tertium]|nr:MULTISPECIES: ERF family protein [Clostridium]MBS4958975.1 ERF family protein [Clostridium sp.]MDB1956591.1 ERF family protein [Clostridium tertium]MDB1958462.1 ERF family protein [Clostridium tertium]MDB1962353.1 ERF family protein [Clostridium tertium]MDB1967643.1 ERF family protein [Clostridium tertium]